MGNILQLIRYQYQYGKENISDLEPDGQGGFFIAVHYSNTGRVQQDIDTGNAFIWNGKLIYTNK